MNQPTYIPQLFIGVKLVEAQPMTRAEYNTYRGWELPDNKDGTDEGYLVEYKDGGKPNDPRHMGYISWSPKEQFDNGYRSIQTDDASAILEGTKQFIQSCSTVSNI